MTFLVKTNGISKTKFTINNDAPHNSAVHKLDQSY